MGVYIIIFACFLANPHGPSVFGGSATLTQAVEQTDFQKRLDAVTDPDARRCDPDIIVTADKSIAERALERGAATVFRVSPKLKVYALSRSAVYHVEEAEQAVPAAPK